MNMASLSETARNIFQHSLQQCSIAEAFARTLRVSSDRQTLTIADHETIGLGNLTRVRIVAAGKAASPMLSAMLGYLPLPPSCDLDAILIAPERPTSLPSNVRFFAGGHPLPTQTSFDAATAALSMLHAIADGSTDDTLCIFLISGGASAMMELPLNPSISLADTVAFHQALVGSGATIVEMNCLRKHFSAVKGGRLALAAGQARKISLLVSDVPPAHLDALASGPALPDTTTVAQAREIIDRYKLFERFPLSIRRFFASPNLPETPKPGELNSPCWKLLDSDVLALAAQSYAEALGFHAVIDNGCDDWPYDRAADYLLNRLRELRRSHARVCLISCGEIAVKLPPVAQPGASGGRNQHFVLYAATSLHPADAPIAILSAGSDGIDGNSTAAGAVLDERSLQSTSTRSSALAALEAFDSFTWLRSIRATIVTGPTGQNLRDLRVLLAESSANL